MFYEVSEADIQLGNLLEKQMTVAGVRKWISEGVTVFRWAESFRHVLRPHRFAMRPYNTSRINWRVFKPDKYYIHVYQTKIERGRNDLRTLSSRSIAQHLRHQWNAHYWPRTTDINMLESMSTTKGRYMRQRTLEADRRKERLNSHSDLSSVRRNPVRRRRRRRRRQLETESSSNTRGEPWRSERTDLLSEERRPNMIGMPERQTTRRRARRRDIGRKRQRTKSKPSQITEKCRPHDLADLLDAIQRVSKDVNQLKRKIELK